MTVIMSCVIHDMHVSAELASHGLTLTSLPTPSLQAGAGTSTQRPGVISSSENSGVAELKEDGQVSCDTAQTCA